MSRDILILICLAVFSLFLGLSINHFRKDPLPWIYCSKVERLNQAISNIQGVSDALVGKGSLVLDKDLSLSEFKVLVAQPETVILDARPEIFYRLGHIPGAISMPRDDFEAGYAKIRNRLEAQKDRHLVVYCSDSECEDSIMVQRALIQLGYVHVQAFRGGWDAWISSNMPTEKDQ